MPEFNNFKDQRFNQCEGELAINMANLSKYNKNKKTTNNPENSIEGTPYDELMSLEQEGIIDRINDLLSEYRKTKDGIDLSELKKFKNHIKKICEEFPEANNHTHKLTIHD